jgi:hypothetical protein
MSKVLDFLSGFSKEPIEHEVSGQTLRFFEVPYVSLAKMKKPLTQLSQAISVLIHNFDSEVGQNQVENKASGQIDITVMPKSADLSHQHSTAKQDSIARAFSAFLDRSSTEAMAWLILQSLQNDFTDKVTDADAKGFAEAVSLPDMVEFSIGMLKANKRMFDPFMKEANLIGDRLKKGVLGSLADQAPTEEDEAQEEETMEPEDSTPSSIRLASVPRT